MNTQDNKFMTDAQFNEGQYKYMFCVYSSRRDYNTRKEPQKTFPWYNNDLTKEEAQKILLGCCIGASTKFKHPVAVLYSFTPKDSLLRMLSSLDYC